jgi:amino acid transporter
MLEKMRNLLVGAPLPTLQAAEQRLNKLRALAAFSPDALSSIAYANQEIYLSLILAGSAGLSLSIPIGIAIAAVLSIVAISYYQTIQSYPSGAGSYIVARENLGLLPGLTAAAALLIDYLLTAAVSLTAGVEAIASAFPFLWPHRVAISLLILAIITLANLRGLRETGTLMAIPVYLFLFTYLPMIAYGLVLVVLNGPISFAPVAPVPIKPLTVILILHAFSTGCTALTGIEAISNGVPAFQPPQSKNAGRTLVAMALLMGVLFLGSIVLTQSLAVVARPQETILSAMTRKLLGDNLAYLVIQGATLLILAVAANTSFSGFPRLSAILASDSFLPRQLTSIGDRLVFANGILFLAILTGGLIVLFHGDTHALIPLFAVGAFLAFTLSQAGMVVHWRHLRGKGWQAKLILNGVGALATGVTLFVIGITKFLEGAWLTIILIPILVVGFLKTREYYQKYLRQTIFNDLGYIFPPVKSPRVVIPVSGVNYSVLGAIRYSQSISNNITALYVEIEPGGGKYIQEAWQRSWPDIPLVVVPSPYRSIVGPILDFLDETDRANADGQLATVVLPEIIPAKWWHGLFHNQTSWMIKAALLYRRRVLGFQRAIIDVPYHLKG